jgi:flagellin-like protein
MWILVSYKLNNGSPDFLNYQKGESMQAKNMLKSKKGITPVLATLLLIVIAVATIVVTYAWITIYMSSAGTQAGVMLNIDAISWPNNTSIVLYVRNTGTSDATISAVYIGTSATNLTKLEESNVTYDPTGGLVSANGDVVTVTCSYNWNSNTMYYFKVVPNIGAPAETSKKP